MRLSIPEAFTGFVVGSLGTLRTAQPDLIVEVLIDDQNTNLDRGTADLALRMGPVRQRRLIRRSLGNFGWSLYAEKRLARARRLWPWIPGADFGVIGYHEKLAHSPGAQWIAANVEARQIVFRCNSLLAALSGAVAGLGVAALPCFLGAAEPTLLRVTPEVIGRREAMLVVHPDRQKIGRVRALLEHLRGVATANAATLRGEGAGYD